MPNACLTPRKSESPRHRHARACRGHPRLSWRAAVSKAWMAGRSPGITPGKLVKVNRPALEKKTLGERHVEIIRNVRPLFTAVGTKKGGFRCPRGDLDG